MDFQLCPECDTLNPPGAKTCEQCKAVLPEVPDFAPPPSPPPEPEPELEPEPEPATTEVTDPPFEAAPGVLAQVSQLEAQIEAKPDANALYLQLAKLYTEGDRKDLAIRTLGRCLEHDPKNVYIRHRLSQLTGLAAPPTAVSHGAPHPQAAPSPPRPSVPPRATAAVPGQSSPPAPPVGAHPVADPGQASAPAGVAGPPPVLAPPGTTPPVAASATAGAHPTVAVHPVHRPARPVMHRTRRRGPSRRAVLGSVLALAVLGVGMKLLLFPAPRCVVTGRFSAVAPEWSPSGRQFAFLMQEGERTRLAVHDLGGGEARPLADVVGFDGSAFAWSPDGRRIAYVGTGGEEWEPAVYVVDVETGQTQPVASGRSPLWTSDGASLLMWCDGAGGVFGEEGGGAVGLGASAGPCRVDVASGTVSRGGALPEDVSLEWGAAVSPVLGQIAFARMGEGGVAAEAGGSASPEGELVEMADSVAARKATNVAEGSRDLARELEARQYMERRRQAQNDAASGPAGDVFVVDFLGGAPRRLTTDGRSGAPAWTADGTRILYHSGTELWIMDADGGNREPVVRSPIRVAPYSTAALTPDGRHVLFVAPVEANEGLAQLLTGETPADLYEATVGKSTARRLANRHSFKQRFALSPDGKRILYEVIADTGTLTDSRTRSELWMMAR
jgi:Tol biopolymer transport system component